MNKVLQLVLILSTPFLFVFGFFFIMFAPFLLPGILVILILLIPLAIILTLIYAICYNAWEPFLFCLFVIIPVLILLNLFSSYSNINALSTIKSDKKYYSDKIEEDKQATDDDETGWESTMIQAQVERAPKSISLTTHPAMATPGTTTLPVQ